MRVVPPVCSSSFHRSFTASGRASDEGPRRSHSQKCPPPKLSLDLRTTGSPRAIDYATGIAGKSPLGQTAQRRQSRDSSRRFRSFSPPRDKSPHPSIESVSASPPIRTSTIVAIGAKRDNKILKKLPEPSTMDGLRAVAAASCELESQ